MLDRFYLKFILWIFLLNVIFSLSCSNSNNKKVGLLLHRMEGRWFSDLEYLQKYANDEGLQLIVKNANGDENKQLLQTAELIDEGVGIILVVAVNQNTAAGIVRKAHDAKIKVVAYDRIILNSDLDYLLTYDYGKIGKMMAEYAINKIPKGNYIELWGDASDSNARSMRKSQEKHLQTFVDKGDINLIHRAFIEDWSAKNAAVKMQKILDFTDEQIDVVLASNDIIARSALSVIEKNNCDAKVIITGQDATLESCQSIANNKQSMTIYKSTEKMAKKAIELASQLLNNENIEVASAFINNKRKQVPTFYLDPTIVDKNNLIETVVADGLYTKNQLFN